MARVPKFYTAQELGDKILASFINARFVAFLARFSAQEGLDFEKVCEDTCKILENAEIPQQS